MCIRDRVDVLTERIDNIRDLARERLEEETTKTLEQQHRKAKQREFKIGDYVFIRAIKKPHHSSKLCPKFEGPYIVRCLRGPNKLMVICRSSGKTFPVHVDLSLIHISEPTRLLSISYAVFCLKKKKKK